MRWHVAIGRTVVLVLVAFLAIGCSVVSGTAAPSSCDGVSAEAGGCGAGQPSFGGTTCAEVGSEWGQAVDAGIRAVIAGPPTADGKQRSARISDVLVVAFVRASQRLQAAGPLDGCSTADFVAAATPAFSDDLKAGIGHALYDGSPEATYEQFLAEVQNVTRGLDAP